MSGVAVHNLTLGYERRPAVHHLRAGDHRGLVQGQRYCAHAYLEPVRHSGQAGQLDHAVVLAARL